MEAAWDAGVVCITAASNQGAIYRRRDDPDEAGTHLDTDAGSYYLEVVYSGSSIGSFTRNTSTNGNVWYPLRTYGPAGVKMDKGIEVAAGQNSQTHRILDGYSNRGGHDIIGKGSDTWTAYPTNTYADGQWGFFSGTSCATPTVVGKAACEMEKFFKNVGRYPTPNEVKDILINQGKDRYYGVDSTDWSNVGSPSTALYRNETESTRSLCAAAPGYSLNGNLSCTELGGGTGIQAFFNAKGFNRAQTYDKRPASGVVYPRPKVKR